MHFFFSGPRIFGIRPGIVFSPRDFQRRSARAATVDGAFLYVIQGSGMVKVGVTTDPRSRIATLQTACPWSLDFAAISVTPKTGYDIEQRAHEYLSPYLVRGEWYRTTPDVAVAALQQAARSLGEPLLGVSLEQVDTILAIASTAPQDAPARSKRVMRYILWFLLGTLGILMALAALGHLIGVTG